MKRPTRPRSAEGEQRGRRRRYGRWALRAILLLVGALGAILLSARLALEVPAVRSWITTLASARLEAATGLRLEIQDWRFQPLDGTLEVFEPRLRSGDAQIFRAERLATRLDIGPLLRGRLRILLLRLEEPDVDLRPAWPERTASPAESRASLDVARFELAGGRLTAGAPEAMAGWLEEVRIDALTLSGSFVEGSLRLDPLSARLLLDGPMLPERELTLAGRASVPSAGEVVARGEVRGSGFELELDLSGARGEASPLELVLNLGIDVARLFEGVEGGQVGLNGRVDLRNRVGRLDLRADDLPGHLLRPWVGEEAMERLTLAESTASMALEVESDRPGWFQGEGSIDWHRGSRRLLAAEISVAEAELELGGEWRLGRIEGEVSVDAREAPFELLRPWLGSSDRAAAVEPLLTGTTLDLEAGLRLAPQAEAPLEGSATLFWRQPDAVLVAASAQVLEGAVGHDGALDPQRTRVRIEATAADFPAERLLSLLPQPLVEAGIVDGTELRGQVAGVLSGAGLEPGTGRLSLTWSRQDDLLAAASAHTLEETRPAMAVELQLLPGRPGRRRAVGELVAPSWTDLRRIRIREGLLELVLPAVPAAVSELEGIWPDLLPESLDPWLPEAALELRTELSGPLDDLDAIAARVNGAAVLGTGGRILLRASGRPFSLTGEGTLEAEGVELAGFPIEAAALVDGQLSARGTPDAWVLEADVRARDVTVRERRLDAVELEARAEPGILYVDRLAATAEAATLEAAGRLDLSVPPRWADLRLGLSRPLDGIERVDLELTVDDGVLGLRSTSFASRWGTGGLGATVPIGTLLELVDIDPEMRRRMAAMSPAEGPIVVTATVPHLDSESLAPLLGLEERSERIVADNLTLSLSFTTDDLTAATGLLTLESLDIETAEHRFQIERPLRLRLADRRLSLEPLAVRHDKGHGEMRGSVGLSRQWSPSPSELVETVELTSTGRLDLSLLEPWLLGGVGSGLGTYEAALTGPPDQLQGTVHLDASGGRVQYLTPYVSRFDDPVLDLQFAAGGAVIVGGNSRLNDGTVAVDGTFDRAQGLELEARFESVRYRLDYGLSAALSGEIELALPPADSPQRGLIAGNVAVERGLVRRDLDLERELLTRLFAPADLEATEGVANIDLDLRISTREGVRVRNNVADLTALWSPLSVRGTLGEPRIDGVVEVEPGGMLYAYGQTLRIDRGNVTLSALPGAEPRLELVATTSLEDPSLGRDTPSSLDPFAPRQDETGGAPSPGTALASGLAEYAADLLVTGMGGPLEGTGITVQPVIIFSESDPDARLVVGRDLTDAIALAVSINLRQAERRTYLLQFHRLPVLQRVQAQVFTNERSNEGATLQQTIDFGGGRRDAPIVEAVELSVSGSISERELRRALGATEKQLLPDGAIFDTELEITELLRRRGHFSPEVRVAVEAGKRRDRARLLIDVDPGPKTEVVFEGERPGARHRISIASIYRTDFYQQASLEEMRQQTVRALRARGFLDPQVEVTLQDAAAGSPGRILVTADGGQRLELGPPEFEGVDREAAGLLDERFATLLSRVELAAGLPAPEREVMATLRGLGYPEAAILGQELSADGRRLTVRLEPGNRQHLASMRVSGVPEEEAGRLAELVQLELGEPVLAARLATAALVVEQDLRRRGYADARVQPLVSARVTSSDVDLDLRVDAGSLYRVSDVEVVGARATRPAWARSLTGVDAGDRLETSKLPEIRSRLYQTGVFSSAAVDYERLPEGEAILRLDVDERPRFTFGYGLRWETDEGGGLVVDLLDRNLAGRGIALGARGLLTEQTELARLYGSVPVSRRYDVESFAEWRNELDEGLLIDTFDTSLQLSRDFGRRTTGRIYGRYREQRFREEDPDLFLPLDVTVKSPFLGLQYLLNRRTDPMSGLPGLFASIDLNGASKAIGSDFEYLRLFGQVNLYRPVAKLGRRRLGWAQSYRVGIAEAFDQILLRDERFFAGGEFSVRGYPTESLGPVETLGDVERALGGEALLVINQELHLPIWSRITGVVFFDAGNVWEERSSFGSDLAKAAGLGVRWRSPIGLLRLDLAFPLDRRDGDPSSKLYLGFGQVF